MAKSIRSKIKRKHRTARRHEYAPTVDARQETRAVRMSAYVARTAARKLASENKEIPTEMAKAAAHADELDIADDQAREKVASGQFFFLHPNSKIRQVPVIPNPEGIPAFRGAATMAALTAEEKAQAEAMDDTVLGSMHKVTKDRNKTERREALRAEAVRRAEEKRTANKRARK